MSDEIAVRGGASAEEIAVALAALANRREGTSRPETGYDRWRRVRLAALRPGGARGRIEP